MLVLARGGHSSSAPWVDAIRLAFAAAISASPVQEAYVPAAHDTGWDHFPSRLQAQCDTLAAAGASAAQPMQYPFPSVLAGQPLLYREGRLVVDPGRSFDDIYRRQHPSRAELLAIRL